MRLPDWRLADSKNAAARHASARPGLCRLELGPDLDPDQPPRAGRDERSAELDRGDRLGDELLVEHVVGEHRDVEPAEVQPAAQIEHPERVAPGHVETAVADDCRQRQRRDWQQPAEQRRAILVLHGVEPGRPGDPIVGAQDQVGAGGERLVIAMAAALAKANPAEIALADTIGVADPTHVHRLVTRVIAVIAPIPVRVHFHNTRGTGLANIWAAVQAGARVVDAALYESVLQVMEGLVPEYDHGGVIRERSGSILPGSAPSNVYNCSDGEYMIGANKDAIWGRLAEAMGRPELADDPRYATHIARGQNQMELDALIDAWTRTMTVAELDRLMIVCSIPAGQVYRARGDRRSSDRTVRPAQDAGRISPAFRDTLGSTQPGTVAGRPAQWRGLWGVRLRWSPA